MAGPVTGVPLPRGRHRTCLVPPPLWHLTLESWAVRAILEPVKDGCGGREFVRRCNEQMERLRQDPEAWDDYWAEAALVLTADDID